MLGGMQRFLPIALWLTASAAAVAPAPPMNSTHLIQFTPLRTQLTLEYIRQHYDPAASSTSIQPVMIVVHWTAINSLNSTLNAFLPEVLTGRADIQRGGRLNTGAQFVVDRDGTIYKLMEETAFARHTIGLNRRAIGIENVGSGSLTAAQLAANVQLVKYLKGTYPIRYLIGHYEYGQFRKSPLWEERDPTYFTVKSDPGAAFMKSLRVALARDGLSLQASP